MWDSKPPMNSSKDFDAKPQKIIRQIILGIDLGTSGIRGCIVERTTQPKEHQQICFSDPLQDRILFDIQIPFTEFALCKQHKRKKSLQSCEKTPELWNQALLALLTKIQSLAISKPIEHIICDATSSTLFLANQSGTALTPVLMYDSRVATQEAQLIENTAKEDLKTGARGISSSLAKALYLYKNYIAGCKKRYQNKFTDGIRIHHQIDWLNHYFLEQDSIQESVFCDENNLLKLGFNPEIQDYPLWVKQLFAKEMPELQLPKSLPAGKFLGKVKSNLITKFCFSPDCVIHAGTTDSIAGFLATGANQVGDATTSLGSTLAIKQLTQQPFFSFEHGIYSHKVKNIWLLGGASNGGGKVLLDYYTLEEIQFLDQICQRIDMGLHNTQTPTNIWLDKIKPAYQQEWLKLLEEFQTLHDYYSLSQKGERFPINDPNLTGRLKPSPTKDLQTFMQSISLDFLNHFSIYEWFNRLDKDQYSLCIEHLLFFNSIIQGLVQIEKHAYELMEKSGTSLANLYSVGGGNKNGYWQILRKRYLTNCIKSPFSENAAYGVTRLIT